ncbi:NAD-dependent epimerase/dehydratase family protein [Dictyobacter aurantiacus]|nr:NAD(P)-dependent oxidoreductase [Dictyobacter aurantiacus]
MRILITGSSGHLGAAIAEQLTQEHQPIGLDLTSGRWTRYVGDITERELIWRAVRGVDAIIHTASLHQPQMATHSRQQFITSNISGTLNLLEAAVQHGVSRFVYTSTTSLYGRALEPRDKAVWVSEDLAPQPRDIYDITKIAAEELCRDIALSTGLAVTCLRVARFFAQTPRLQALYRLYRGVDVRDAARAHVLAVNSQGGAFDILNISASSPFQQSDLSLLLSDPAVVLRRRTPHVVEAFAQRGWPLPTSIDRVYDITRAKHHLGYQSIYGFDECLREH